MKSFLKRIKIPHVFVLLAEVILVCSILTYVVPSGHYERKTITAAGMTKTAMVPGTYREVPKHITLESVLLGEDVDGKATPVSLVGLMSAIPRGLEQVADIVFLVFIVGGVISVIQRTGTITASIHALLTRFSNSAPLLTIVLMIAIAIGGSTIGMGEELIPLVPIFLVVSWRLGYDRVYGVSLVYLAAAIGFAAATTNPFTVQIAQGIAEVPLTSGMRFRIVFFAVCMTVTLANVLLYGRRIKRNPAAAIAPFGDDFAPPGSGASAGSTSGPPPVPSGAGPAKGTTQGPTENAEPGGTGRPDGAGDGPARGTAGAGEPAPMERLRPAHIWILTSCVTIFALIIYLMQARNWWLNEMSGGFLLMGVIAVAISRIPVSEATKAFVRGMEEMVVAALVVGFARGIQVVLSDGEILDTIIYWAANALKGTSEHFAAIGMLAFQTVLNFFIPSGSGQAAVTMPLMAPLSDLLGITRQTAVFAFTCGDGFSNTIIPTSGILMAVLAIAKIPFEKWLRFAAPLFLQLIVVSGIFLVVAVAIGY